MFRKLISDERGQAVVEMALITPILLMLLLGIVEFARLYNAYLTIDHATRAGVRIGTLGASDSDIESKIVSLSGSLPNSTSMSVYVSPTMSNRVRGNDITVNTGYSFEFIAPLFGDLFGNPMTIESSITMRLE